MTQDAIIQDVENFLAHHGIQGQKWGVRHGPPYPLKNEDFKLKKGTKFYRSSKSKEDTKSKIKYLTKEKADRDFYRKFIGPGEKKTYEFVYKANKKLNMAGETSVRNAQEYILNKFNKKQKEAFLKSMDKTTADYLFKNNSGLAENEIAEAKKGYELYKKFENYELDVEKLSSKELKRLELGSYYSNGKLVVDNYMKAVKNKQLTETDRYNLSLGGNAKAQDLLFKHLTDLGYDGMLDVAGRGTYRRSDGKVGREGIAPIIVFDTKNINHTKTLEIDSKEKDKAYRRHLKTMNKQKYRYL